MKGLEDTMEYKKVSQKIGNIVNEQVRKLAQLFPSAVKDGKVDFEALKEELGQFTEVDSEKYELKWAGKQNAKKIAQEDIAGKTLKFISEDSKDADITENLYIEGDNLEVLKLLRQNYYGAVKLIYIDPPYNTGNDFVYNDSFVMEKFESDVTESNISCFGERYTVNSKSQNKYHANWLNMMYPRIKIAKDLIADDGVIFISIDDNEATNLKKICNEIFGEENYITSFPWRKRTAKSDVPFGVSQDYEQVVCYAKTDNFQASIEGKKRKYYESDDYPNKPWRIHDLTKQTTASERPNSFFTIVNPKNGKEYPANPNATWRITEDTFDEYYCAGRIVFPGDYDFLKISKPVLRYWKEDDMKKAGSSFGRVSVSTHFPEDIGMSKDGTKQILEIFGSKVFNYPKPVSLLKHILSIINDNEALVLDFFSGSASMAHAVMEKNSEDKGSRNYIMIQLPEICEEKSEAYQNGYKNICEIGKERIRRAGEKIKQENPDVDTDIGFKVFRVADTNIKWNSLMDAGQLDLTKIETTPDLVDFMPGAKDVDIVYELMLRQRDVPLSETLELLSNIGNRIYLYASSYLICLETEVTVEIVNKLAEIDPLPVKFIFRDSAFKDDIALKDETFRRLKALIDKNTNSYKSAYTIEFI
jgi:Adenine specific DNA methylase Mod